MNLNLVLEHSPLFLLIVVLAYPFFWSLSFDPQRTRQTDRKPLKEGIVRRFRDLLSVGFVPSDSGCGDRRSLLFNIIYIMNYSRIDLA